MNMNRLLPYFCADRSQIASDYLIISIGNMHKLSTAKLFASFSFLNSIFELSLYQQKIHNFLLRSSGEKKRMEKSYKVKLLTDI